MNKLPSGPTFRIINTLLIAKNPYNFYPKILKKYGDPVLIKALNGNVVLSANPDLIKLIFSAKPDSFTPFAVDTLSPLVGQESIFLLHGNKHKRERKLLMPPFHGDRMKSYGEIIQQTTVELASKINKNTEFCMQDLTTDISLEVILKAVFGLQTPQKVERFKTCIHQFVSKGHPALFFSKALQRDFAGIGPWSKFQQSKLQFDSLIYDEISLRKQSNKTGHDILTMMMESRYEDGERMSDRQLRDELVSLSFAGHETTAIALAWAFYHLFSSQDILNKLKLSIKDLDPESIVKLPILKSICKEALRLYPVITDVIRVCQKPFKFGEFTLPAGTAVAAATCIVHHDHKIYSNPLEFKADRFLNHTFKPWEYFPFGGGNRRCIGAAFAEYEMALVLATIIYNFELTLIDQSIKPIRRNVTMGPDTGVRMKFI